MLWAAIGSEQLPDYRGCFLRGLDVGADGSNAERDTEGSRKVGSLQKPATALPTSTPFVISKEGDHAHELNMEIDAHYQGAPGRGNTFANSPQDFVKPRSTLPAGSHSHTISGGDKETRPVNVAVHWIIKFR